MELSFPSGGKGGGGQNNLFSGCTLPISLAQVSLWRAQMFGGSFETSSQKSKTVQQQTVGVGGGGSIHWRGAAK